VTARREQLIREREFHDQWALSLDLKRIDVGVAFEGSTAPENRFILSKIGNVNGRHLLDLGCGAGESSIYFALKGARCVASDWSPQMVAAARQLAEIHQVDIEARVIDAVNIDFRDNTFDIVYAANLLHHVDTRQTLREIRRILKPGGVACTWDPLKYNPFINVYRRLATKFRTPDEHPLGFQILRDARKLFTRVEYETFWFATLWVFLRFFLFEKVHPSEERYWKKILEDESRLRNTYMRLEKLDRVIKKISIFERLAWNIAIVAVK
jgi:ubiquinone/menaquinone biosynthesis C-methylase UbiE